MQTLSAVLWPIIQTHHFANNAASTVVALGVHGLFRSHPTACTPTSQGLCCPSNQFCCPYHGRYAMPHPRCGTPTPCHVPTMLKFWQMDSSTA